MTDTAQKNDTETMLRERIQHAVDELPLEELYAAERYVSYLRDLANDPFLRLHLNAPFDDEPVTPEEEALVQVARDEFARGEYLTDEEMWRELGHEPRG